MRAGRLLSILILLQLRGRVTAQRLAEEFEVSLRTVYRDIDALSAAGVPLYAERGPGGGFRLLDGYRTRLTGLTAAEAEGMPLMGLPAAAADLGLGEAAAAARLKLLAALPAAAGEGALRVADRFHLDPLDWYRRGGAPRWLPVVAQGVWEGRRVALRYESWTATVERTVDPLGLVLKAGAWYLVARVGDSLRTYRLAKVLQAALLDARFERPADFELAAHWQAEVARFERSLRRGRARLRVAADALPYLDRLGAEAAEAILAVPSDAAGRREATVPIEGVAHAAALLIGFGMAIEVLSPSALRTEIARLAASVSALYGGPAQMT